MKYLNLSNSIYQQKGSGLGLTVKDGMLINNRPNSMTGIAQACEMKKMIKRAEKISMYSEAISASKMQNGSCNMY
jgi:chaperonin GroEL (HSP60 family)